MHSRLALVALVVATVVSAGCSAKPTAVSGPASSAGSPPSGERTTTPVPGAPHTVTVTDRQDGSSVTLHAGDRLRVVLASTYWMFQPSSESTVLRADGPPVTRAKSGCLPGEGCGTVSVTYTALRPGTAKVTATRASCGEAMACTGAQGAYVVRVKVD